jgi:single-strand DNA-binding protein
MASLNKVMLIGNLTRDPEVRYTPKGSAVADLAIAVNRSYQTDSGERMEEVTYVDVVVWARLAELAGQYLHKGSPVFFEGRLQMDTWEDKATGQKRSKIRVVAENMQFLGGKGGRGEEGGDSGGGYGGGAPAPQRRQAGSAGGGSGYPQRQQAAQRPPQRPAAEEDFGEGPITDDLDGDEIPF